MLTGRPKIVKSIHKSINTTNEDIIYVDENINQLLYEGKTVRITYTGTKSKNSSESIEVTIENLLDKNITVQTRNVLMDGLMCDPIFSCDIVAKKYANDNIIFYSDNFPDEQNTLELSFHIFNTDSWDTISDTEPITIDVSK